jgi:hypothetical protein
MAPSQHHPGLRLPRYPARDAWSAQFPAGERVSRVVRLHAESELAAEMVGIHAERAAIHIAGALGHHIDRREAWRRALTLRPRAARHRPREFGGTLAPERGPRGSANRSAPPST